MLSAGVNKAIFNRELDELIEKYDLEIQTATDAIIAPHHPQLRKA